LASETRSFLLLCAHCFFAFAALGTYFPYFALFLREHVGLTSSQIGVVIAISPLVGLLAQPTWGHIADRTGSRVRVLVVLCIGATGGFAALARAQGMAATVTATFALSLFLAPLFPLSTSVMFAALPSPSLFGRVRVWGTIGYLVTVVGAPRVLELLRVPVPHMFYVASGCCLVAGALAALLPARAGLRAQAQSGDLRALLSEGPFVRVLVFTAGIQLCLHGPMQLFPLYVRSRGGTMTDLSNLWICMLLLEAPLIFGSSKLFATFGVARMMLIASAGGGVRWLVCSLVPALSGVYAVQALHALVVTGLSVGTALYVEQIVPERLRSTAQSTVVMVGSSVGGVLSSTIGGVVVDRFGVDTLFMIGGAGALLFTWAGRELLSAAGPLRARDPAT